MAGDNPGRTFCISSVHMRAFQPQFSAITAHKARYDAGFLFSAALLRRGVKCRREEYRWNQPILLVRRFDRLVIQTRSYFLFIDRIPQRALCVRSRAGRAFARAFTSANRKQALPFLSPPASLLQRIALFADRRYFYWYQLTRDPSVNSSLSQSGSFRVDEGRPLASAWSRGRFFGFLRVLQTLFRQRAPPNLYSNLVHSFAPMKPIQGHRETFRHFALEKREKGKFTPLPSKKKWRDLTRAVLFTETTRCPLFDHTFV